MATNQDDMKQEYANFVQQPFDYVNQEISNFRCSIVELGHVACDMGGNITHVRHVRETIQTTLEQM